jgi:hypothetical protein
MTVVRTGIALVLLLAPALATAQTILVEAGRDATLIEEPEGSPHAVLALIGPTDEESRPCSVCQSTFTPTTATSSSTRITR